MGKNSTFHPGSILGETYLSLYENLYMSMRMVNLDKYALQFFPPWSVMVH